MRKVKIIIANDNKNLAELEKKYIEKMDNIDIIGISTTSQEEIELIEKYNPDVVITDILRKNDEISGLDIIKQYENKKDIRFILITASSIDEIIFQNKFILPNNIIRYIKSPFDWNTLCIEIEKALICLRYKLYDESDDYEQRYYSEKIVNLYKELSKNELDLLDQLNILIENKKYTRYEFDKVKQQVLIYYENRVQRNASITSSIDENLKNVFNTFDKLDEKYIYNKI